MFALILTLKFFYIISQTLKYPEINVYTKFDLKVHPDYTADIKNA